VVEAEFNVGEAELGFDAAGMGVEVGVVHLFRFGEVVLGELLLRVGQRGGRRGLLGGKGRSS